MKRVLGSSVLLILGLAAAPAAAQSHCYKGDCSGLQIDAVGSNYEQVTIGRGYDLPPLTLEGIAGGSVDASYLGRTDDGPCRGFATALPDHQIVLTERTSAIELAVNSRADTLLIVNGPDGWRCNDDGRDLNPELRGEWRPGTYRIWVASYDGDNAPYTLSIRDGRTQPRPRPDRPVPPRADLDTDGAEAIYDTAILGPEQLSGGVAFEGRPGGAIDLETLGSTRTGPCDGFAGERPHHIITIAEPAELLAFSVESDIDTTLAVLGPDGWACNDDDAGFNPGVADRMPAGTYRVWVGTYRLNDVGRYRLVVSDLRAPLPEHPIYEAEVLEVVGSFEGNDVAFEGYTPRDIFDRCQAHMATVGGMDWVDDITLQGRSYRNTFGYWTPGQLCALAASSVASEFVPWIAEGTIEDVPFRFGGDTREEIQSQCSWFLGQFPDLWMDDMTVNGTRRHNDFAYWEAGEACMIVSTLATQR